VGYEVGGTTGTVGTTGAAVGRGVGFRVGVEVEVERDPPVIDTTNWAEQAVVEP